MSTPKVVITDLSLRPAYYQWFLYGLMLKSRKCEIDLRYNLPLMQRLSINNLLWPIGKIAGKIGRKMGIIPIVEKKDKNFFKGYIEVDGAKKKFCIDSADAPFLFSGKDLRDVDTYFKIQCPKEINKEGFPLGKEFAPYVDVEYVNTSDYGKQKGERKLCHEVFEYKEKIKPLLLAVRIMSPKNNSFKTLDAAYKNLLASRSVRQTKKAMCYFGDAHGPNPTENLDKVDWDWESDIMAYLGDKINHPNEKRGKIANVMNSLGPDYDARVINRGYSDTEVRNRSSQVIPLKDFSRHVAQFTYNINVSGYRMSIPARFIDSFVVGTAIATDNLYVKWYHPFGEEVVEFGEMGYHRDEDVDYAAIKQKLVNLKPIDKQMVIDKYEKYWAPEKCAEYIVRTVLNTK